MKKPNRNAQALGRLKKGKKEKPSALKTESSRRNIRKALEARGVDTSNIKDETNKPERPIGDL